MESGNEDETEAPPSSDIPASFTGRLNLASYAFSPGPKIKNEINSPEPLRRFRGSASLTGSPTPSPKRKLKDPTSSLSPRKKGKSTGYAPPSTYAHLPELRDVLEPNLICVFIGLNPGITTSTSGHAYAHPSNLFWKLLHSSGCTTRRMRPNEDGVLPRLFSLGNTNIVSRPTRNGSELSRQELDASVHILEAKISLYTPEAVCIVGKGIWDSIFRVRNRRAIHKEEFRYGWQEEKWEGARVFVATSTSGLAAGMRPEEKARVWRELGVWVEERRRMRGENEVGVEAS